MVFESPEDAEACIRGMDSATLRGKTVKACLGTTKYCHAFLKGQACGNPDCQYLHELGAFSSRVTCSALEKVFCISMLKGPWYAANSEDTVKKGDMGLSLIHI